MTRRRILYGILSVIGGLMMKLLVPDGPFRRTGEKLNAYALITAFRNKKFRACSFGYFGHMWELYAFWAFVPVILTNNRSYHNNDLDISFLSFLIIASGGISCILGGMLSQYFGAKRIAAVSLFLSCTCCLVSPFFLLSGSTTILIIFLLFWGLAVIASG